jgi:hypothetical protein
LPVGIIRPTKSSGDGIGGGASSAAGAAEIVDGAAAAQAHDVAGGKTTLPQRSQFTDAL